MTQLTENDKNFGPFTFGRWSKTIACYLEGPSNDDRICSIMLIAFGRVLRTRLPRLISPFGKYGEHSRRYGFSLSDMGNGYDFMQIFYGPNTHDSSTTRSWSKSLPWKGTTHVRRSIYTPTGEEFYREGQRGDFRLFFAKKEECPKVHFGFEDFDGELIVATCMIEEREWHNGQGSFRWLRWFSRPMIRRSLDLAFSAEVGPCKGSWKGGTVGHGIDMLHGETAEQAFRRYCANEHSSRGKNYSLRFIGPCSAPPPKVYAQAEADQAKQS